MVCIAAFIILALIGVFVAIISIFKPKIGKAYLKAFKKAWGCLWKKVRLQKCETGFKDDVKNTILSRVIIKHPTWTKPLSIIIEILSVAIVVIAVWALIVAVKSLLALWALGTCNVTKPTSCSLGAEVCSIDEKEPDGFFDGIGRWFTEWGEIFEAIPDKFKTYNAADYPFNYIEANPGISDKPIAVDIFDPGCVVCARSYLNQKASGFFESYEVRLVPFPIPSPDGGYKFKNSEIITRYLFATEQLKSGVALELIDHIFTDKDADNISYQDLFNNEFSEEEAVKMLETWLKDAGLDAEAIAEITKIAAYPEISDKISENRALIENTLKVKGIPTMLYDDKKHTGLYIAN